MFGVGDYAIKTEYIELDSELKKETRSDSRIPHTTSIVEIILNQYHEPSYLKLIIVI